MKKAIIFATLLLQSGLWAASSEGSSADEAQLRIKLSFKSFYDSKEKEDFDHSHVSAHWGNRDLKDVLENFDKYDFGTDSIYEVSVKVSAAPTLVRGRTEDQITEEVDKKIESAKALVASKVADGEAQAARAIADAQLELVTKVREGHQTVDSKADEALTSNLAQVPKLVDAQIKASVPNFDSLPANQQEAIRAHVTSLVTEAVRSKVSEAREAGHALVRSKEAEGKLLIAKGMRDAKIQIKNASDDGYAQVAKARSDALKKVSERLDQVQKETSLQEVAIGGARMIHGRRGIVYLRLGKFSPDAAAKSDGEGKTFIDNLRPKNDVTTRLTGSAPTGAVALGWAQYFDLSRGQRVKLRADAYLFHEREPFESAKKYITEVVQMNDEDFADHQDLHKLNTAMLRLMAENDSLSTYVTGAKGERHEWIGAGVDWQPIEGSHLVVNGYQGDRAAAKKSLSAYITHDVADATTVYAGGTVTKGLKREDGSAQGPRGSRKEAVLGVNTRLHPKILGKSLGETSVSLEGYLARLDEGENKDDEWGLRLGVGMKLDEGPSEKLQRLLQQNEKLEKKIDAISMKSLAGQREKASLLTSLPSDRVKLRLAELQKDSEGYQAAMRKLYEQIKANRVVIADLEKERQPRRSARAAAEDGAPAASGQH